jgi:hypothetical protein
MQDGNFLVHLAGSNNLVLYDPTFKTVLKEHKGKPDKSTCRY